MGLFIFWRWIFKWRKKLDRKIILWRWFINVWSGILYDKRHGKGKECDYGRELKFEGEYLNGERNGRGKEYYEEGTVKFEGEFLNGERLCGSLYDNYGNLYCDLESENKLIKEYNHHYKLEFEGEYLKGKWNGKGKDYSYSKLIFEGEYLNGKRNGKSKEYYDNGKIKFENLYNYRKIWNDVGHDILNNKVYELKNGRGYIKEDNYNGKLEFEGEHLNDKRSGKGIGILW